MKKVIFTLASILIFKGLAFTQTPQPQPAPAAELTTISFDKTTHDFGTIKEENGKVKTTFTFTNTGKVPLTISNIQPSCGCTVPEWSKEPVLPGKSSSFTAEFSPAGKSGQLSRHLNVYANIEGGSAMLTISANVIPKPIPAPVPVQRVDSTANRPMVPGKSPLDK